MSSYNHMQSAANSNRFRSFMSATTNQQGIYSHQTSGSETDVSTSNENLSNEDRYVIRHTARQEPQGQENLQLQVYSNSNRNSQRESSSSYNTLIIHSLGEDNWTGRNSGAKDSPDNLSLYNVALGQPNNSNINIGVYDSTSGATKRLSQGSNCPMSLHSHEHTASNGSNNVVRIQSGGGNVQEITDIPDDYLNQSSVLKHLAKEATKSPGYSTIEQIQTKCSNDLVNSADYGGSNQSPQKQHIQHQQHMLYHNSNCSPTSPCTVCNKNTLSSSQHQQHNRPSSATNTQQQQQLYSNCGKNNLSKSQPDLSRTDLDTANVSSPNSNMHVAVNSVATTTGDIDTVAQSVQQQQQQQQHYSVPVLMRNSGGNGGALYAGVGSGPRYRRDVSMPRPRTRGRDALDMMLSGGGEPFVRDKSSGNETWSADMIDMLLKENSALKLEVENCYARIGKSQKLEQEVLKVHSAHEDLVASCERRERLERTARTKLQLECRRLQDTNRLLRDQLDMQQVQLMATTAAAAANVANNTGGSTGQGSDADDGNNAAVEYMRREMTKRDLLIAQFITQNKELGATKERQEIELTAQRATLQEQRTHIDILEAALTNAQGNVVRLEEECRKKQAYVERVGQLQRALSAMQIANDRREQTERSLRLQLELELERTNNQSNSGNGNNNSSTNHNNGASGNTGNSSNEQHMVEELIADLKRQLREREEKLMRMEGECSKWEQRYLEESALRQAAIDATSIPKDAKIAALEKTSQETEKIIAEARTDKIRHMDEAHAAQKKVADLESRLKDLESKLAERDAMIRVLNQKHTSSYSPHHTPHPSTSSDHHHSSHVLDHVLASREELVSSVLTSSTGFGSGNSYSGSDSSFAALAAYGSSGSGGFDATKKTLDSQIKEIDSQLDTQLLTKDSLIQSLRREKANYPNHYWRV